MGQRLTIIVKRSTEVEDPLAVIYYHWSAYTISTFEELEKLSNLISTKIDLDNITNLSDEDIQLELIKITEGMGGGIDLAKNGEELEHIKNKFPNEKFREEGASRTNGLVCISEEGMDRLLYFSEGIATIFLEEQEANSEVWLDYVDYQEYVSNVKEEYLVSEDKLERVNFAFTDNIKFSELPNVITQLKLLKNHHILDANDTIIQLY